MSKLVRFGVSMDGGLLQQLDRWIRGSRHTNRSEAVRDLVRGRLVELQASMTNQEVVATVTLVYDHHKPQVARRLTELQHDAGAAILASLHVHLDHHNCLEVIALRGPGRKVQSLAADLIGLKGVKHGKLASTVARV